jgi:hypothetical protein
MSWTCEVSGSPTLPGSVRDTHSAILQMFPQSLEFLLPALVGRARNARTILASDVTGGSQAERHGQTQDLWYCQTTIVQRLLGDSPKHIKGMYVKTETAPAVVVPAPFSLTANTKRWLHQAGELCSPMLVHNETIPPTTSPEFRIDTQIPRNLPRSWALGYDSMAVLSAT